MSEERLDVTVAESGNGTANLTAAVNALAAASQNLANATSASRAATAQMASASQNAQGAVGLLQQALGGVAQQSNTLNNALGQNASAFGTIGSQLSNLNTQFGALTGAIGGFMVYVGSKKLIEYADTFTNIENKLRLTVKTSTELTKATQDVFNVSQQTRTSFEANVAVYQRIGDALKSNNKDMSLAAPLLRTIAQATALSGSSAQSARLGLYQFQQALASGKLSGQEFNSVMEQLPGLARVLADGLKIGIGQLREQANAQKLTTSEIIRALTSQAETVDKVFNQAKVSVSSAYQVLENALVNYIGNTNNANNSSATLAKFILTLANNVNLLVPAMIALGGAVALVGFVNLAVAIGNITVALAGLTVAVIANTAAWLANPIVLGGIVLAITGLVVAMKTSGSEIAKMTADIPILGDKIAQWNDRMNGSATAHIDAYNAYKQSAEGIKEQQKATEETYQTLGNYQSRLPQTKEQVKALSDAHRDAAKATNTWDDAIKGAYDRIRSLYPNAVADAIVRQAEYNMRVQQGKTVTFEWSESLGRYVMSVEQLNGSIIKYGDSQDRANASTNAAASAMDRASDSALGYGRNLYGVSDAANNMLAITGQTTEAIQQQINAIMQASTYVDRYNNSVSAMSSNLGTDGQDNWGGTKGSVSVPTFSYPGNPQITIGAGQGAANALANVDLFRKEQEAWMALVADFEKHGGAKDGRINTQSDYAMQNMALLKPWLSKISLQDEKNQTFFYKGGTAVDPTVTKATDAANTAANAASTAANAASTAANAASQAVQNSSGTSGTGGATTPSNDNSAQFKTLVDLMGQMLAGVSTLLDTLRWGGDYAGATNNLIDITDAVTKALGDLGNSASSTAKDIGAIGSTAASVGATGPYTPGGVSQTGTGGSTGTGTGAGTSTGTGGTVIPWTGTTKNPAVNNSFRDAGVYSDAGKTIDQWFDKSVSWAWLGGSGRGAKQDWYKDIDPNFVSNWAPTESGFMDQYAAWQKDQDKNKADWGNSGNKPVVSTVDAGSNSTSTTSSDTSKPGVVVNFTLQSNNPDEFRRNEDQVLQDFGRKLSSAMRMAG